MVPVKAVGLRGCKSVATDGVAAALNAASFTW